MMAKSNQLTFLKGKESALKTLFKAYESSDITSFGYLAIGYDVENTGFEDKVDGTNEEKGFKEINSNQDPTYERIALTFLDSSIDPDTSKARARFTATLPPESIVGHTINQFAVVNTSQANDPDTIIYSASNFPPFSKTNTSSLTFLVTFKM